MGRLAEALGDLRTIGEGWGRLGSDEVGLRTTAPMVRLDVRSWNSGRTVVKFCLAENHLVLRDLAWKGAAQNHADDVTLIGLSGAPGPVAFAGLRRSAGREFGLPRPARPAA